MDELVVDIKNLNKQIKGNVILNSVNLEIKKGQVCGIIGRNGSGKTVLFKLICGLMNPTSGTLEVLGEQIKDGKFPRKTGAIIENPGFIPMYSAFDNLKFLASINNDINDKDITKAIESVGLDPNDKKRVKNYSLGMKQRLGIAQAIMEHPKLLILDEPMNALDKESVNLVRELLLSYKERGVTILLASHNSEDIKLLCDCVYVMDKGVLTLEKA